MFATLFDSGSNLVELDDVRPPPAKLTKVPSGTGVYTVFRCTHPDADRMRETLWRITLGGKRLTLQEQRLVNRMLVPVMDTGQGLSGDMLVGGLMHVGYDLTKRRAVYGPQHRTLRAWLELRVSAVWAFESQSGNPPDWLTDLCEILAQEAIRPAEVARLTPANYFTPWEREAKIKYY